MQAEILPVREGAPVAASASTDLPRNAQDEETCSKGAERGEGEAGAQRSCGGPEVAKGVGGGETRDAPDRVDEADGRGNYRGAENFRRDGPEGWQIDRRRRR